MPLTPQLRQDIDDIRNYLFGGGYPDPVTNAEQLAFLFFFYLADGLDKQTQARARLNKQAVDSIYGGDWTLRNPLNAPALGGDDRIPRERFRWSQWARALTGENLVRFIRDEVFPFYTEVARRSAVNFMDGARLVIDEPVVLTQVIGKVDGLRLDEADADTKGDLFEHVLKQIKTAGELGQFRTPRHIIRAIVAMLDPKMVRLATMNLTLRGLPAVHIQHRNVLTTSQDAEKKRELGLPDGHHVIAANPPFSGRLDKDRISEEVKVGTSTATELLFIKYMMDSLLEEGRCGVIVPEGVLFGSTGAHKELRRQLIENNRVEAVLTLPGGVFQPYSGVKTSVLFFRKGGRTERVLFLHADNDGYKLDANHDTPIEADDLPMLAEVFKTRDARWQEWQRRALDRDTRDDYLQPWWFADAATIRANDFNLSASRYRPMNQTVIEHRDPRELLDELAAIEAEIVEEVDALKAALSEMQL